MNVNVEDILYIALGFIGVIFLKWLRGIGDTKNVKVSDPVKKCHDIFEYNFLDEYESQNEEDEKVKSKADDSKDCADVTLTDINMEKKQTRIEAATNKLLATIRNRRERTAVALMNAVNSINTTTNETEPATAANSHYLNEGTGNKGGNRVEFSKSAAASSNKYLAFLGHMLKDHGPQSGESS